MAKSIMKVPFGFKGIHACKVGVIMCLDFRFRRQTLYCIEEAYRVRAFDLASLPGSSRGVSRDSQMAISCVTVPCDLHDIETLIIVHHMDCGAYRGSERFNFDSVAEQAFYENELRKSRKEIMALYPAMKVILIYAKLVDNEENVEFLEIEDE
ncbi:MAG: carbonic anhydrase [Parcubacteria group bacterium]